jgi:hypothetical protein
MAERRTSCGLPDLLASGRWRGESGRGGRLRRNGFDGRAGRDRHPWNGGGHSLRLAGDRAWAKRFATRGGPVKRQASLLVRLIPVVVGEPFIACCLLCSPREPMSAHAERCRKLNGLDSGARHTPCRMHDR